MDSKFSCSNIEVFAESVLGYYGSMFQCLKCAAQPETVWVSCEIRLFKCRLSLGESSVAFWTEI